jgi:hypothetical protein
MMATSSSAANCEQFQVDNNQLTEAVHEVAMETIRVTSTNPIPYTDDALCKANKRVADLANILLAFDPSCFLPDDPAADKDNLSRMIDDAVKSGAIYHCPV